MHPRPAIARFPEKSRNIMTSVRRIIKQNSAAFSGSHRARAINKRLLRTAPQAN
jgi:hypothetical protein